MELKRLNLKTASGPSLSKCSWKISSYPIHQSKLSRFCWSAVSYIGLSLHVGQHLAALCELAGLVRLVSAVSAVVRFRALWTWVSIWRYLVIASQWLTSSCELATLVWPGIYDLLNKVQHFAAI